MALVRERTGRCVNDDSVPGLSIVHEPPSSLYKYQPVSARSLANLKSRAIWFARPGSFNDPFDCTAAKLAKPDPDGLAQLHARYKDEIPTDRLAQYFDGDEPLPKFVAEVESGLSKGFADQQQSRLENCGVCCFSETAHDVLMWGHYSDGHRGFCLEFDTSYPPFSTMAHPVQYSDQLPLLDPVKSLVDDDYNMIEPLVCTKFTSWSSEREWRLIHQEPDKAYIYDWKCLRGVYFGCAMPAEFRELICMLLVGSPTLLYQMERSDDAYALKSVQKEYTPFNYGSG